MTAPVSFSLDVEVDSDASEEELRKLIAAAKKGCFIEQTLAEGIVVGHRLKLDGKWHEI